MVGSPVDNLVIPHIVRRNFFLYRVFDAAQLTVIGNASQYIWEKND